MPSNPQTLHAALAAALLLGGCGTAKAPAADDPAGSAVRPAGVPAGAPASAPPSVDRLAAAVPVETYLAGGAKIPERLKVRDLTLRFRSNVEGSTFECRTAPTQAFAPCADGDSFAFHNLANRSSMAFEARARSPQGTVDATPLRVAFAVDVDGGSLPTSDGVAPAPKPPASAADLVSAPSLPLGGFFSALVPTGAGVQITGFSTDKTYNGRLEVLRLLAPGDKCARSYERTTATPGGAVYCEATPTRAQLVADASQPLPRNHVEISRTAAGGANASERLILAAFDAEADTAEAHMGTFDSCRGATASGVAPATLLRDFYAQPGRSSVAWCQVKDAAGAWWWIASYRYETAGGKVRLEGIYAASAELGIFSGQDFAERTAALSRTILVPTAPAP